MSAVKNCRIILIAFFVLAVSSYAVADVQVVKIPHVDDVYPELIDWRGKIVLHIGDSHVAAGLTAGFRKELRAAGAFYRPRGWVGSRSKSWIASGRFRRLLEKITPHIVIVTLGTNVMTEPHPERQISWVKTIAKKVGTRRCFWLGPPPLLEDKHSYNQILKDSCTPCRYFDTRQLGFKMHADKKFHLTRKQGERWAAQAWRWMNGQKVEPLSTQDIDNAL